MTQTTTFEKLTRNAKQLLHVNGIRYTVALGRYFWFAVVRRKLRMLDPGSADIGAHTVSHNLKGLKDLAGSRSSKLIRPLSVVDALLNQGRSARILTIGPRTEGEILNLMAHGFSCKQIRGLDLISYSPWIDLGDMHAMPYPDSSFDVVIVGWTLAYSENPRKAVQEIVRVARPGAIVAIGVEHNPLSPEQLQAMVGYVPGGRRRIRSTGEIAQMFEGHLEKTYFAQDVLPEHQAELGSIILIASVRK
jgi:SAM-dependent methyltransferase